jgi:hypothetical protein
MDPQILVLQMLVPQAQALQVVPWVTILETPGDQPPDHDPDDDNEPPNHDNHQPDLRANLADVISALAYSVGQPCTQHSKV